jgi:hypothetical protein
MRSGAPKTCESIGHFNSPRPRFPQPIWQKPYQLTPWMSPIYCIMLALTVRSLGAPNGRH